MRIGPRRDGGVGQIVPLLAASVFFKVFACPVPGGGRGEEKSLLMPGKKEHAHTTLQLFESAGKFSKAKERNAHAQLLVMHGQKWSVNSGGGGGGSDAQISSRGWETCLRAQKPGICSSLEKGCPRRQEVSLLTGGRQAGALLLPDSKMQVLQVLKAGRHVEVSLIEGGEGGSHKNVLSSLRKRRSEWMEGGLFSQAGQMEKGKSKNKEKQQEAGLDGIPLLFIRGEEKRRSTGSFQGRKKGKTPPCLTCRSGGVQHGKRQAVISW